jgi:DNA-binding transcriptional LysR family regulator
MDLRHLRYFLAVAEEQNFTRAAARLHISQPPLSQQIQQLEREMDVLLFHRTPVGAMLTQAGQRFASDAREILRLVDQAVLNAQRAARGELGTVRIGFTSSAAFHPFITGAVREFRSRHPNVGVELIETNTAMQLEGMRNGRIDVAFIRPAAGETASLHKLELFDEPMLVALPQAHRLAGHEKVRLRDLSEDDFVL